MNRWNKITRTQNLNSEMIFSFIYNTNSQIIFIYFIRIFISQILKQKELLLDKRDLFIFLVSF